MSRKKTERAGAGQDNVLPFGLTEVEIAPVSDLDAPALGVVLPSGDVEECLGLVKSSGLRATATILDPWYNIGVGGVRDDYKAYILNLIQQAGEVSDHVFLWGFPEIVARFVDSLPSPLVLTAWLTWYYKNNPSVIRGWRSSQMACLHISQPGARMYPEHFLNSAQLQKKAEGKLRYMPGPTSVIEESLLIGFVGRKEQTGHPAQKPVPVIAKLIEMTTVAGDLVLDPMCGSGTTGMSCKNLGRRYLLNDHNEDYVRIVENRLGHGRKSLEDSLIECRPSAVIERTSHATRERPWGAHSQWRSLNKFM